MKRFAFLATFAVGCMALASNVDNTTRYFKGGIDIVGGDIKQSKTDATFAIKSDTADGTTSTTVAAVTLSSTVNVTNGDLVLNVENSAGDNLLTVDEQGLLTALTDIKLAGNDITGTGTGATFAVTSSTADATTSTSVAAVTLNANTNIADGDLILNVENSVGDNLLTVDEQGLLTVLTDVKVAGNDITGTGTAATFTITSDAGDGVTSGTVAALTLKSSVNVTNGDLVLNVENSAGDNLLTVNEQGALVALTGITGTTVSATTSVTIGSGTAITKILANTTASTDIGSTAANQTTVGTVTVTGAALGDVCTISPSADDAAWDEGVLACFVEATDTVKWQFHADVTGADPAAMTYKIVLTRF